LIFVEPTTYLFSFNNQTYETPPGHNIEENLLNPEGQVPKMLGLALCQASLAWPLKAWKTHQKCQDLDLRRDWASFQYIFEHLEHFVRQIQGNCHPEQIKRVPGPGNPNNHVTSGLNKPGSRPDPRTLIFVEPTTYLF